MTLLADDRSVARRILDHIDRGSTDVSADAWREPVRHYRCPDRLELELTRALRRTPTPFCPSAAIPGAGDYLARDAAGVPLLAVRGRDGQARVFRNACRHRGMVLAERTGCRTAFVCRYHGWTYGQDGALRHVPHGTGFPDLDTATHGLVPVPTVERHGLVFVTQDGPELPGDIELDALAGVVRPGLRLYRTTAQDVTANWKIVVDGFLEGYHLRATHRETFYPIQFDNLNVVERFGRNSRVAFPYRRIGKLRALPPESWSVDGMLTYVYHLFPNVMVATFPFSVSVIVNEPLGVDRTRMITYTLTDVDESDPDAAAALKESLDFQADGLAEDQEVARAIQHGLASGANEHFEFGLFEGALTHFHRTLGETVSAGG